MLSDKFIGKWMRLAKQVGEDQNPCHSRKIGTVLIDPESNSISGTGYNGPPKKTPHTDSEEYLKEVFLPQLTQNEKKIALSKCDVDITKHACQLICDTFKDKKICPRKIVGAKSGERLELCSCVHSEANAIIHSTRSLKGAYAFCWCGVPCGECSKLIINSGIVKVYCLAAKADYTSGYNPDKCKWLFKHAGVEVIENSEEYYLEL